MARDDTIVVQYCAAIAFILAVSYTLIITNPPSELKQWDENENIFVHKKLLAVTDLQDHGDYISVFLLLFGLLSFFIGLLVSIVYEKGKSALYPISIVFILSMSALLFPYYGVLLPYIAIPVGLSGYFMGVPVFSPRFRKDVKYFRVSYTLLVAYFSGFAISFVLFLNKVLFAEGLINVIEKVITPLYFVFIISIYGILFKPLLRKIRKRFRNWRRKRK